MTLKRRTIPSMIITRRDPMKLHALGMGFVFRLPVARHPAIVFPELVETADPAGHSRTVERRPRRQPRFWRNDFRRGHARVRQRREPCGRRQPNGRHRRRRQRQAAAATAAPAARSELGAAWVRVGRAAADRTEQAVRPAQVATTETTGDRDATLRPIFPPGGSTGQAARPAPAVRPARRLDRHRRFDRHRRRPARAGDRQRRTGTGGATARAADRHRRLDRHGRGDR